LSRKKSLLLNIIGAALNSYVVCIKTIVMVEAKIEINTAFLLRWVEKGLIKLADKVIDQLVFWVHILIQEIDFFIQFEYTRSNIIQHLTEKASAFFGFDPDQEQTSRRKKKMIKRKYRAKRKRPGVLKRSGKRSIFKLNSFISNRIRQKKSKKNKNYFNPKKE